MLYTRPSLSGEQGPRGVLDEQDDQHQEMAILPGKGASHGLQNLFGDCRGVKAPTKWRAPDELPTPGPPNTTTIKGVDDV